MESIKRKATDAKDFVADKAKDIKSGSKVNTDSTADFKSDDHGSAGVDLGGDVKR